MGEYAEMMLDGTCCCSCGEFLDSDGDGVPAYCWTCKPDEIKPQKSTKGFKQKPDKIVGCLHAGCRKRFIDENAMKMHLRTAHIDKDALREKQEKDKKLNAMRNDAPALLEALEEITERYVAMINSGDCGNWNPEGDQEVIKARVAIATAKGEV